MSRRRSVVGGTTSGAAMLLSCAMGVAMPSLAHAASGDRGASAPSAVDSGAAAYDDEHVHVRRGDTLEHILAYKGVGPAEAAQWLYAARGVYDMRRVKPKRGFSLRFDRDTGQLESVRYEIDDRTLLTLQR